MDATAASVIHELGDECYRCGYDLRGIADDQPCPECGLIALRSRRETDELHDTRPRWLQKLARGVYCILAAILAAAAWPFAMAAIQQRLFWPKFATRAPLPMWLDWFMYMPLLGFVVAALFLMMGVWLLSAREGYELSDRADRTRRLALRFVVVVPLLALLAYAADGVRLMQVSQPWYARRRGDALQVVAAILTTVGCVPLPLLLFYQLRSLARRARSAHLAEHCAIVGVGTSASLLYFAAYNLISQNAADIGLGRYWAARSATFVVLTTVLFTAAILFFLWSLYLLIRFAIAFGRASRQLRRKWLDDDRSTDQTPRRVTASPTLRP